MWFVLLSVAVLNLTAFKIKKALSRWQMYHAMVFAVVFELLTNVIFDLKYDMYGYFSRGVDFKGFLYVLGIYPAVSVIFLNGWYRIQKKGSRFLYLCIWVIGAVGMEYIFLLTDTFYYNGWTLWYSAILYPVILLTLLLDLHILTWLNKKSK